MTLQWYTTCFPSKRVWFWSKFRTANTSNCDGLLESPDSSLPSSLPSWLEQFESDIIIFYCICLRFQGKFYTPETVLDGLVIADPWYFPFSFNVCHDNLTISDLYFAFKAVIIPWFVGYNLDIAFGKKNTYSTATSHSIWRSAG